MIPENNQAIFVLGMHRSGTSAFAGVLRRLGVNFGEQLMPAQAGVNDKGFYEHLKVVEIHEKILRQLGYHWQDVRPMPDKWWQLPDILPFRQELESLIQQDFLKCTLWGMKDPRTCRLLPLWIEILSGMACKPRFLIVLRDPDEVVESLRRRDGMESEAGYCLWLWHVLDAIDYTQSHQRCFVMFSALLDDWRGTVASVSSDLGVVWPRTIEQATESISEFVDQRLQHCVSHEKNLENVYAKLSHRLYEVLKRGGGSECDEIIVLFMKEITKRGEVLEAMTQIQVLRETVTHHERDMIAEKGNARAQIEYRDAMVAESAAQLVAEKDNARSQIEYRDAMIAESALQLSAEKDNARSQIEYRDKMIAESGAQLAAEKDNARSQIEYRDKMTAELAVQLTAEKDNARAQVEFRDAKLIELETKMTSRMGLVRLFLRTFKKRQ